MSPFGGVGSTAALVFVLVVAGVKAVWEDTKRHQEDKRMNTSITHKVNADGEALLCHMATCGWSVHRGKGMWESRIEPRAGASVYRANVMGSI